jgi:hypothetical protein
MVSVVGSKGMNWGFAFLTFFESIERQDLGSDFLVTLSERRPPWDTPSASRSHILF